MRACIVCKLISLKLLKGRETKNLLFLRTEKALATRGEERPAINHMWMALIHLSMSFNSITQVTLYSNYHKIDTTFYDNAQDDPLHIYRLRRIESTEICGVHAHRWDEKKVLRGRTQWMRPIIRMYDLWKLYGVRSSLRQPARNRSLVEDPTIMFQMTWMARSWCRYYIREERPGRFRWAAGMAYWVVAWELPVQKRMKGKKGRA